MSCQASVSELEGVVRGSKDDRRRRVPCRRRRPQRPSAPRWSPPSLPAQRDPPRHGQPMSQSSPRRPGPSRPQRARPALGSRTSRPCEAAEPAMTKRRARGRGRRGRSGSGREVAGGSQGPAGGLAAERWRTSTARAPWRRRRRTTKRPEQGAPVRRGTRPERWRGTGEEQHVSGAVSDARRIVARSPCSGSGRGWWSKEARRDNHAT